MTRITIPDADGVSRDVAEAVRIYRRYQDWIERADEMEGVGYWSDKASGFAEGAAAVLGIPVEKFIAVATQEAGE